MKKILLLIATVCCVLSSCTTYKAVMSEASKDPITNKLPKMELDWYQGDIKGANFDFVKNIINNEINSNIISTTGKKQGTIEVNCKKLHLKINGGLTALSGLTCYTINILGFPFASVKVDMTLEFKILDIEGAVLDSYEYSAATGGPLGIYYGKDGAVCMVDATKEIMKKFRDNINSNTTTLIAKLESAHNPKTTYYVNAQVPTDINKKEPLQSDVDKNIPLTTQKAEETFALIIANEDYQFVDDVNFATHDGEIFKEYCIKTLGIPERQVRYCANASYGVISGGVDWLKYALDNFEGAKAIVYYCGHGIPDEKTNDAYIMPVDGKGTNMTTCYSLNLLYKTLANTKASNVTYFMDACFTGANKEGSMLVAARGVAREAKKEILQGNSVVFSASSSDETAMTYPEKGHGLFTYFLLKKLQETSGNISYFDLATYLNKNVKKEAFLINEKPQTPVVATSASVAKSWKTMTFR